MLNLRDLLDGIDTSQKYYDNSNDPSYVLTPWNDNWNITVASVRGNMGDALLSPYYGNGGLSRKICDGTSGFSAYLVGYIMNGTAAGKTWLGDYRTSSRATATQAWYRSFLKGTGNSRIYQLTSLMMSVRCIKNQ